jgi:citrate lyase subunit beta/citryl-CoA lyase
VLRAKLEIAAACLGHGKLASHCVVTEFKDSQALATAAQRAARELGYQRMWSIHPAQVRVIVEAFAPSVAEVDEASEILLAAQAQQWAPVRHRRQGQDHDRLHDRASYRYCWQLLERAHRTGQPLVHSVRQAFFADVTPVTPGAAA